MYFLADIHGDFYVIEKFCRKNEEKKPITVIQIGDFGAGFSARHNFISDMDYLNQILAEYNVTLYVIRGNHDDPQYFDGSYNFWSNLKLMADYSVIEVEGKRILLIGGAISIDRLHRVEGRSYWKDEVYKLDEGSLMLKKNIDIVATHTAPSFAYPTKFNSLVYSFADGDPTLLTELTQERVLLDRTYELLKANENPMVEWFYGHFHTNHITEYENTTFRLLDINRFHEYTEN